MNATFALTLDDKLSMLQHRGFDRDEALGIMKQHLKENIYETELKTLSRALQVGKSFENDEHWNDDVPFEDFRLVQIIDGVKRRDPESQKLVENQQSNTPSLFANAYSRYRAFKSAHPELINGVKVAAGIALALFAPTISGCGTSQQSEEGNTPTLDAPPDIHSPGQLLPPGGEWKTYQLPGIGADGISSKENADLGLLTLVDTPSRRKIAGEYQYFIEQYYVNNQGTDNFRFKLAHWDKTRGLEVSEFEPLDKETVERLKQMLEEDDKKSASEKPDSPGQETGKEKTNDGTGGNLRDEVFKHEKIKPEDADQTSREVLAPHVYRENLFKDPGPILKVSDAINEFPYNFSPLERHIAYEKATNKDLPEQRIRNYFGNLSNRVAHRLMDLTGKATLDDAVLDLKKTQDGKKIIIRTIAESLIKQNWVYRPVEKLGDSFNPDHVKDNYIYSDCNTCVQDAYLELARNLGLPLSMVLAPNHAYISWDDADHSFEVEATASRKKEINQEQDGAGEMKVVEKHLDVPDYNRLISEVGTHHSQYNLSHRGRKRVETGVWFSPVSESTHLDEIIKLNLNSDRLNSLHGQLEENPLLIADILRATEEDALIGYKSTNSWVIYSVYDKLNAAIEASLKVGAPILAAKATNFLEGYMKRHNGHFLEDENDIPLIRRKIYSLENPKDLAAKLNTIDEGIYDSRGMQEALEDKKKDYQQRYNTASRTNNFDPFLELLVQETGESAEWVPLIGKMGQYLQVNNPQAANALAEKAHKKMIAIVQGIAERGEKHEEGTPENDVAGFVANNIAKMLLGESFWAGLREVPWGDFGIPEGQWDAYNRIYRGYEKDQQSAYNQSKLLLEELRAKFKAQE